MEIVQIMKAAINEQLLTTTKRPLVIGISGPQGSGKSYICSQLGFPVLSLDDLYYDDIDRNNPNELLNMRGLPGTHDIDLGVKIIEDVRLGHARLCRYDKSFNNGKGRRLPESDWESVNSVPDVLLVEGWCLGFQKVPNLNPDCSKYSIRFTNNDFEQVNDNLMAYTRIYQNLDYFIQIKAQYIESVYKWRWQQEETLHEIKKQGMNKQQVHDFVDRFMPCYDVYLQALDNELLARGSNLQIVIDEERQVQAVIRN